MYVCILVYAMLSSEEKRQAMYEYQGLAFMHGHAKTTKRHLKHWFILQLRDILPHFKRTGRRLSSTNTFTVLSVSSTVAHVPAKGNARRLHPEKKNLREKLDANIS